MRAAVKGVRSLAEVLDLFRGSSDKRRHVDVVCGYCSTTLERSVESKARKWFVSHVCVGPAQRPVRMTDAEVDAAVETAILASLLCEVPSGGNWRDMENEHRGGRRIGVPTPEQIENGARVDAILTRILGGVPRGHSPRGGRVVAYPPLRLVPDEVVTLKVAA